MKSPWSEDRDRKYEIRFQKSNLFRGSSDIPRNTFKAQALLRRIPMNIYEINSR